MSVINPFTNPEKYMAHLNNTRKNNLNHIIGNIYIGMFESSTNIHLLIKNNIKYIINITMFNKPDNVLQEYRKLKINHYTFKFVDDESVDISRFINDTNKIINKAVEKKQNILVHCQEGISRSPTAVIAYLIKQLEIKDVDRCISILRKKRPCIRPNIGFIKQLKEYAKSNKKLTTYINSDPYFQALLNRQKYLFYLLVSIFVFLLWCVLLFFSYNNIFV